MAMVSAVAIDPPQDVLTPLQSFYLVRVRDDRFAENLGTLLGANRASSLFDAGRHRCGIGHVARVQRRSRGGGRSNDDCEQPSRR